MNDSKMREIKLYLNSLIAANKKHIRIYDKLFDEYKLSNENGKEFFLRINNETYKVDKVVEMQHNNISISSFYLNVISKLNELEDDSLTSWIVECLEYLKIRIYSIYKNDNNAYLYHFQKATTNDDSIIMDA